jgi:c-di-GMP-binding flagellar brake protein YcgR
MLSNYDPGTKLESTQLTIENWLKKLFRWKSKEIPADLSVDRRDFYRLEEDDDYSLDLCLTMEDERVFCTVISDMSANGFSCHIPEFTQIQGGQSITALLALPLEEPVIIKTEAHLISVKKGTADKGDFFRFRFCEDLKNEGRDLIHRYILQKQFENLGKEEKKNSPHF